MERSLKGVALKSTPDLEISSLSNILDSLERLVFL